jgi:hypothetical protein
MAHSIYSHIRTNHASIIDLHRASRTVTNETLSIDGSAIPDLQSAAIFDGDSAFDVPEDVEKVLVGECHFAL